MPGKKNGYVHVILLIIIFSLLLVFGYLAFKYTQTPKTLPVAETIPVAKVLLANPDQSNWVDIVDKKWGISYKHPKGWEVVYAISDNYVELDIKNLEKNAFVFASITPDDNFKNDQEIREAISKRESTIKSLEALKVVSFTSSVQGGVGSYTALGEKEWYLVGENSDTMENMQVATFNFKETGAYKVGGKSVILNGFALPGSENEKIVRGIMESFKLL